MPHFRPAKDEEWYYQLSTPAAHTGSVLYTTFVQPHLKVEDPTYGRGAMPIAPAESAVRNNPAYEFKEEKAYLNSEQTEWIYYQVYIAKEDRSQVNADIICVPGVHDYGGKWAIHVDRFIQAGYRLILLDVIGHGRSTGLHAYIRRIDDVINSLDAVLCDIAAKDKEAAKSADKQESRKRFVIAASMGSCATLLHTLRYPVAPAKRATSTTHSHPSLDGVIMLCPMLQLTSASSYPSKPVELIGRLIARGAGRWPLAPPHKWAADADRYVEEEWEMDPQTYTGDLRLATGLACLAAMREINTKMHEIVVPFKIFHGLNDGITSPEGSQRLVEKASSADKTLRLLPGLDHIVLRRGRDEAEDAERQDIISDMLDWLNRQHLQRR